MKSQFLNLSWNEWFRVFQILPLFPIHSFTLSHNLFPLSFLDSCYKSYPIVHFHHHLIQNITFSISEVWLKDLRNLIRLIRCWINESFPSQRQNSHEIRNKTVIKTFRIRNFPWIFHDLLIFVVYLNISGFFMIHVRYSEKLQRLDFVN